MQFSRYRSRYQDGCYDLADLPPLDDAAHVWSKDLTRGDDFHDMEHLLSADELQRANRFRFARDRDRYVIGRAWLRRVLAAYLRQAPADLVITYGPQGKPQLAVPAAAAITFNASGSLGRALLAVSTVRQIGVDIELVRAIKDAPALAKDAIRSPDPTDTGQEQGHRRARPDSAPTGLRGCVQKPKAPGHSCRRSGWE